VSQPCATTFAAWRALVSQAWTVGQDVSFLNGWVSEVIVLGREATAVEVARVEKYLAAKWGISGVHAPATATSDPVGAWLDKSGNARHATQSTAGNRPLVGSVVANGRRGVNFGTTSNSQKLSWVPSSGTQDWQEVFAVGVYDTAASTFADNHTLFGGTTSALSDIGWQGEQSTNSLSYAYGTFARRSNINAIDAIDTSLVKPFPAITSPFLVVTRNTNNTLANGFQVGNDRTVASRNWRGRVCEVVAFSRTLTATERSRIARYLATKYGITLAPQVSNADAQDWVNRVYANGGTVSAATAAAVNTLCDSLESSGIRDRFYRMNLFCGNSDASLAAVRTPLFLGPSLGSPQGNTTDTNNNFVAADYSEASGLQGNGSTKYLNTGVPMNFTNIRDYHLSSYVSSVTSGNLGFIGADTTGDGVSPRFFQALVSFASATRIWVWYNYGTSGSQSDNTSNSYTPGLLTGVGSAAASSLYVGASSVGSAVAQPNETASRTFPIYVFAYNNRNAVVSTYANARLGGYSLGLAMNATQIGQYNTALAAFNSAMGRA
jgi:hypothetical protein